MAGRVESHWDFAVKVFRKDGPHDINFVTDMLAVRFFLVQGGHASRSRTVTPQFIAKRHIKGDDFQIPNLGGLLQHWTPCLGC